MEEDRRGINDGDAVGEIGATSSVEKGKREKRANRFRKTEGV